MAAQLLPYTSEDLTKRRMPPLVVNGLRTFSVSQSNHIFIGSMTRWDDFEMEVREVFRQQAWNPGPQGAITWERQNNFYDREQVACATESGVSSRFLHQVGHTMTCVGMELRMGLRFGDWHGATKQKPDITIWKQSHESLVAGEVKTPWTLDLGAMMAHEYSNRESFMREFTRCIGQVANYMKTYRYKYGFLTTYNDTVFVKHEICEGPMATANGLSSGSPESMLWYSNPIRHDIESLAVPQNSGPLAYRERVSLRECMLYLMRKVEVDGTHQNLDFGKKWTKLASSSGGGSAKLLAKPSPPSAMQKPSGSQTRASSSRQPQQSYKQASGNPPHDHHPGKQHPTNSLADQMNGLHLKEKHSQTAPGPEPKKARVRWSSKRNSYMYTARGGEEKKVDGHKQQNGSLWVKINGEKYLGIEGSS
ncbi:MAG: hypothetical protein Q9210_002946 [Variospora velana]